MIRLASTEDLPAIDALIEAAYSPYIARIGAKPGPMLEDYAQLVTRRQLQVLEDQGQVVGLLVLIVEAQTMLLDNIAVHPEAQGRGHGRQLIEHAEARARQLGLPRIRLYTNQAMAENLGLYQALGYRETHRAVDQGFQRVFMEKYIGGVDANGAILTLAPIALQPAYRPVLDDLCRTLENRCHTLLGGIYLYGSVARGDAREGESDLDVTLILNHCPNANDLQQLERVRGELQDRHPLVSKIDFDIGTRDQVLAEEHRNSWGYWLKHHCRCIWGEDLAQCFAPFKPSPAIARAVNADLQAAFERYVEGIADAGDADTLRRLQRAASRKALRAGNMLRSDKDPSWPLTLEDHADQLRIACPQLAAEVEFFLRHAYQPEASAEQFLEQFGAFNTAFFVRLNASG
ncbi:putative N-acetyltransferase YvbK [compost metagenome]